MSLWIIGGVVVALIAALGTALGLRRRGSSDYQEKLDSRDEPNGMHNEGQGMAAAGLNVRSGGGRFGPF
jgi:hypothetical protein